MHHVVIRIGIERFFIGRDCANRVGSPMVRRCVREQMTAEQIVAREAKAIASNEAWKVQQAELAAVKAVKLAVKLQARFELLRDIIEPLEAKGTEFHSSLASQLREGSLSHRQAEYAVKGVLGRYSKRVAEQWDSIYERCVSDAETVAA